MSMEHTAHQWSALKGGEGEGLLRVQHQRGLMRVTEEGSVAVGGIRRSRRDGGSEERGEKEGEERGIS